MLRHLGLIAVCACIVVSVGCDGPAAPSPPPSMVTVEVSGRVVNADAGDPVGKVRVSMVTPPFTVSAASLRSIVIGIFSGYFFNPTYTFYRGQGLDQPALHIKKEPAFLEGKFTITKKAEPPNSGEESRWLLGALMMILLERMKG